MMFVGFIQSRACMPVEQAPARACFVVCLLGILFLRSAWGQSEGKARGDAPVPTPGPAYKAAGDHTQADTASASG
jgi:hypothetical protein